MLISFLKRRKIAIIVAVLAIVVGFFIFNTRSKNGDQTILVSRGDLVRTVELAGKVIPADDADLSFEVGGTVSRVYKKVGDTVRAGEVIVELDQSTTRADMMKARADLSVAEAELEKLSGGADILAQVSNSKTSVIQNILDAYTDADDAIYNKADQFFEDPRTPNPEILFSFDDYALRNKINASRVVIEGILSEWKRRVSGLSVNTYTDEDLEKAKSYLRDISIFLDDVARAVNSFKTSTSVTQTMIDKYRADIATARQNINSASAVLISGEGSLTSKVSDVPVQAARVLGAKATVANYEARLAKMSLRSPIAGIVSRQEAKLGESVTANSNIASVISGDYKIEAYVPEVSVSGIAPGAIAKVTLDAYGNDVEFEAKIVHLDPRETIRDGVSTYKIDLAFSKRDERVRSGMTSNISIETMRKNNVVLVPERSLKAKDGNMTAYVKSSDGSIIEREIVVGNADSKGDIEVISGLSEGDLILLDPKE